MNNHDDEQMHKPNTPPKRNLFSILPKMISLIPTEGECSLKRDLQKQLEKAAFTAPENIYNIWVNVQNIITYRFKNYTDQSSLPEWCSQLLDIWTDRENQSNSHRPCIQSI